MSNNKRSKRQLGIEGSVWDCVASLAAQNTV